MPTEPGQGCRQQVSAGSLGAARPATSSAEVSFLRCDSEESGNSQHPLAKPPLPRLAALPLNGDQQRDEREQTWPQPPVPAETVSPGLSASGCKLSDMFPRLTPTPPAL